MKRFMTAMTMRLKRLVGTKTRTIISDAVLGAVCGALYGTVFGGLGALVRDEPWRIFSIAGGWAVAGIGIGILGGALQLLVEKSRPVSTEVPSAKRLNRNSLGEGAPVYASPLADTESPAHATASAKNRLRVAVTAS